MIYIETGTDDVFLNFGFEYYFATEKILDGDVFMLWRTSPTVMIGKYQNVYEEVDVKYVHEKGINLVRRLSGGGTIYTDPGGYQYSIIGSGSSAIEFEGYISPVCEALREAGVPAECGGRNDLTVNGRKISGNAQYKISGRTVHHGSLLFSTDISEMERATALPDYKIRSKSIKSVRDRVANISSFTDRFKTPEEFKDYLVSKIAGVGDIYIPDESDLKRIRAISDEKFRNREVIYSGCLSFGVERLCRFDGGTMIFNFEIRKGIIENITLKGDFFTHEDTETLTNALTGIKYEASEISKAVEKSGFSAYKIDNFELARALISGIL